ncbi:hypothetical protein PF007_g31394, partial [Phytophthora fragariae]
MSWTWTPLSWRRLAFPLTRLTGCCWVSTLQTSSSDVRRAVTSRRARTNRPPRLPRLPRSLAPVLRRHPRQRHIRRNASGTRPLGRRPRVRLRHSCPPPSGLAVRLSTFGRGLRPLLHNVQAVLRVISK